MQVEKVTSYNVSANTTTTRLTIQPPKGGIAHNVTIIEYIPKSVAATASELTYTIEPHKVLNDDPLIMWHFTAVDERVDLDYTTAGEVDATGNTIISTTGVESKGTAWHIILPVLLIPLLIIALIGIPRMLQKKQR